MSSSGAETTESPRAPYEIVKGINGMDKIILRQSSGSSAEVYLYGAHVTSWKNERQQELLFVSNKFYNNQSSETHKLELAIRKIWAIDPSPPPFPFPTNSPNMAFVDLILKSTKDGMKFWPHMFEFRLRVTLGPAGDLTLISRIRNLNLNGKPFTFKFAYQTYFSVSDISDVRVEGLETQNYLDSLQNDHLFTDQGDGLTFESEVDRVYISTPTEIAVHDHNKRRTYGIRKDGLPDAVVWNPWDKKAKALADFENDEYMRMVRVGPAAIEQPITLKPGKEWIGEMKLSQVCSGQLSPPRVNLSTPTNVFRACFCCCRYLGVSFPMKIRSTMVSEFESLWEKWQLSLKS